jgi:hypothetical protein
MMLEIFETFSEQPEEFFKEKSKYLINFVYAIQQVKPFELSCDFLMDEEKDKIKTFIQQLDSSCENDPTMFKVK